MRLVTKENHRYVGSLENSMINKTYIFQFVNTYISNFVYIFFDQDFKRLQQNMITIMVFKQVFYNLLEYLIIKCTVHRKLKKVNKLFIDRATEIEIKVKDN